MALQSLTTYSPERVLETGCTAAVFWIVVLATVFTTVRPAPSIPTGIGGLAALAGTLAVVRLVLAGYNTLARIHAVAK